MSSDPARTRHSFATSRIPVALLLGIPVVIGLMLTAFAAPVLNSGAKDLPIAVSGPEPAVEQLTHSLATAQPGVFNFIRQDSPEASANAIKQREAVGGIALTPDGVVVQLASGAGVPYVQALTALGNQLAAVGQEVSFTELAPTTHSDPSGGGLAALALPPAFGGLAGGVALLLGTNATGVTRVLTMVGISGLGGLVATAVLQYGFDTMDGSYLMTSLALAAGICAIGLAVVGLGNTLGRAGIGLAAILMLFFANPLSGLAAGPAWLPAPWGTIGQFLPVGASGTAVRSNAYFEGAGATHAWWVLVGWISLGGLLALVPRRDTENQKS